MASLSRIPTVFGFTSPHVCPVTTSNWNSIPLSSIKYRMCIARPKNHTTSYTRPRRYAGVILYSTSNTWRYTLWFKMSPYYFFNKPNSVCNESIFFTRTALAMRGIACLCVCVSVCLSVTRRYCIKTAKRRITQKTPRDSPGTLVFWRQESLMEDPLSLWNLKFALKVTRPPSPFRTPKFWPISAHSASTVRAAE